MARNQTTQRSRTANDPLLIGTFDETSIRYLMSIHTRQQLFIYFDYHRNNNTINMQHGHRSPRRIPIRRPLPRLYPAQDAIALRGELGRRGSTCPERRNHGSELRIRTPGAMMRTYSKNSIIKCSHEDDSLEYNFIINLN